MSIKVCHMTSAHRSNDTRIFHKQCVSLASKGYEVYLVAAGESYNASNVQIVGIGEKEKTLIKRMLNTTKNIYKKALELDADIYHLHDPELLPYALKLKKKGKKVIFDSHEDYLSTISVKSYIPKVLRPIVVKAFHLFERHVIKNIDGAVVCYHWTEERYKKISKNVSMILNFPILDNTQSLPSINFGKPAVSFAGGISSQWCHKEILKAIGKIPNVKYELAGKLGGNYGLELQQMEEWKQVNYHGVLPFEKVYTEVYSNSSIGMALLDYIAQCKGTVGNLSNTKFFEYMYMGLPLVCTDFTLWREIIEKEKCGICVNPHNIEEITQAITFLLNHPEEAKQMGENGRRAVVREYNWKTEEKKLFELYSTIL